MNCTLCEWYLAESGGDQTGFRDRLADGQRIGQAFFNSCTPADQSRLRGSLYDPFHGGMERAHAAIEFLTGGAA